MREFRDVTGVVVQDRVTLASSAAVEASCATARLHYHHRFCTMKSFQVFRYSKHSECNPSDKRSRGIKRRAFNVTELASREG